MDRPAEIRLVERGTRTTMGARLAWSGVAVSCAAVLVLACWLRPDRRGFGTHEQLGMPPCSFVVLTRLPCPTCGMTTAFALMMHGHPWLALKAQPAGAILSLGTVVLLPVAVVVTVTGRSPRVDWDRLGPTRLALAFGLLILGGWAFKMACSLLSGALPRH
jgi:hypothetical protein